MNLHTSIKQLWHESKANPVYTALYIGGVTFTVTFAMLYAVLFYVKITPIYPEYNRDSTVYLYSMACYNNSKMQSKQARVGLAFVDEHISHLKNCEFYTVTHMNYPLYIQRTDGGADLRMLVSFIDSNFFRLYEYDFVAGGDFEHGDHDSGLQVAIITDRVAKTLFGNADDAIGKDINIEFKPYRVRGVVREGSSVNYNSYSQIFVPFSSGHFKAADYPDPTRYIGQFDVVMKAKDPSKIDALKDEMKEVVRRINAADTEGWSLEIMNMPSNTEAAFGANGTDSENFNDKVRPILLILLVILIIPAINISGMIGGQMGRRMTELGIRRSFGANKSTLCSQVMIENFILTLVGGAVGLLLVWIILTVCQSQILGLLSNWENATLFNIAPPSVTAEMLFSPVVFIGTLVICVVLNVISAYIPVRMALHRPIVTSLNQKR